MRASLLATRGAPRRPRWSALGASRANPAAGRLARRCRGSDCRLPGAENAPATAPWRARTGLCRRNPRRRTGSPPARSARSPTDRAAGHGPCASARSPNHVRNRSMPPSPRIPSRQHIKHMPNQKDSTNPLCDSPAVGSYQQQHLPLAQAKCLLLVPGWSVWTSPRHRCSVKVGASPRTTVQPASDRNRREGELSVVVGSRNHTKRRQVNDLAAFVFLTPSSCCVQSPWNQDGAKPSEPWRECSRALVERIGVHS
jgi:hypothetical protein